MSTTIPARPTVWNLPNQLTASRFVLALILFVLIERELWLACLCVFIVASFTDWLDGYLARRQGLTSTLGRNLDPLVDKVVVCGAYIFLLPVANSGVAAWMVTVVVGRELIITGLRSFMEMSGATFGADWLGKIKMVLQCVTLFAIFGFLARAQALGTESPEVGWEILRDGSIYAMLLATALSGLQYLWRAFQMLKPADY